VGVARTAIALFLFLLATFNREVASHLVRTWNGFSPWYPIGLLILLLLFTGAKVNYEMFMSLKDAQRVLEVDEGIPPGPPVVMGDDTFSRVVAVSFDAAYDIIKPRPQDVFKYEKRGFERIFVEHQGLSCQIVIGGTSDKPDIVPMRRRKIGEGSKKLLRTAYTKSARPDLGSCFIYDASSDHPTINLDEGTELVGYYSIEAVKELYGNQLAVPHPTERNLHWLTELGKGWAVDIIERNLA
jgi:hypothetical protein